MFVSHPIAFITLTSLLRFALSVKRRRFFLHSYSRVFPTAKINNDSAMSSLPESLPDCGNFDANVMADNQLSSRCKSSSAKCPELMSCSNHLTSPTTSVFSQPRKVKRRIQVDFGFTQANRYNHNEPSFCSSFDKSPRPSHFLRNRSDNNRRESCFCASFDGSHRPYSSQRKIKYASGGHKMGSSVSVAEFKQYDICFCRKRNSALKGVTSHEKNKESWIQMQEKGTKEGILRSGMVLLKHFLTHNEQVEMVKKCRNLGLGPGGFYQPGYAHGAKLRLLMMCMGMDWDPQTRKYGYTRVIDGSKPPNIPNYFSELVFRAIQEAHYLINDECRISCVEEILPSMTPDICIVNFYTTSGRLGLHQDRDESTESLRKGLPVVSFSIGDSAEFLYGDNRDVEKAENVLLESGDVLIFGGESRHVFHGVSSIIPDSAPQELLQDTCLRPGRLNLTFRQY